MGLLTKDVYINLSPTNINYYRSLGYDIPKRKNNRYPPILVKTKDLQDKSFVKVNVDCECCKSTREITYYTYTRINQDGKTYCHGCVSKMMSGENSPNWKSNKTQEERENYRMIDGYNEFVKTVMARDDYTCQCCGKKDSSYLNVHHLNSYNWFIEGRTDVKNGITLCKNCHDNFHHIYGKGNNTKEQFEEWMNRNIELLDYYDGHLPSSKKVYCLENNTIYENAIIAAKELNTQHAKIYDICNGATRTSNKTHKNGDIHKSAYHLHTANGYHFLWYEDYLKMSQEDIKKCLHNDARFRAVICVTTLKVFNSIKDASSFYNCGRTGISCCCRGESRTCGQLEDGTRLQWMYYDEYLSSNY